MFFKPLILLFLLPSMQLTKPYTAFYNIPQLGTTGTKDLYLFSDEWKNERKQEYRNRIYKTGNNKRRNT